MVQYVMILLNGGTPIVFATTEEPAAYGELISIGGLGPGVNGKLSSTIAEILQTKLQIDGSRFYIKFYDVQASVSRPFNVFWLAEISASWFVIWKLDRRDVCLNLHITISSQIMHIVHSLSSIN